MKRHDSTGKAQSSELGSLGDVDTQRGARKRGLSMRMRKSGKGVMNLKRYVSPDFMRARKDPIQLERNDPRERNHNVQEMVEKAMGILRNIQHEKHAGLGSIFDEMEADEGWQYIHQQIFQLPRSERFLNLLEVRLKMAYTTATRRY
mgnify:CR=1 FL=1|jgi:hypothetical protein